MTRRIGIDLGGTKISAVLLERSGQELLRLRLATATRYQQIIDDIASLVQQLKNHQGDENSLYSIGVGTPGASMANGLMKNCNTTALNGKALKHDLQSALCQTISMANDADCFTIAEAKAGNWPTNSNVFGVILGTGVGGGLLINNALVTGVNGISGEWGHNPFPRACNKSLYGGDIHCYCGASNCIETVLSGPGAAKRFYNQTGVSLSTEQLAQRYGGAENEIDEFWQNYIDSLARGLATVINIVDPNVVVIGGGLSQNDFLYAPLRKAILTYVFSSDVLTQVCQNHLGDDAGVIGAAYLPAN